MTFQGFTFLISSDYERAEWRETIREQQKKCELHTNESVSPCWNKSSDLRNNNL